MPQPDYRAQIKTWLNDQDPGDYPTTFIRKPDEWGKLTEMLPKDATFMQKAGVGVWVSAKDGKPLQLVTQQPTGRELTQIMDEYENKPGMLEQIATKALVNAPTSSMNAYYNLVDPDGTKIDKASRNAGVEGARMLVAGFVTTTGLALIAGTKGKMGAPIAGAGAQQMGQLVTKALSMGMWDFGIGAAISRGSSALFGPEAGLQSDEEAARDVSAGMGAGLGLRGGKLLGEGVRKLTPKMTKFLAGLEKQAMNWANADKIVPRQLRFYNRMVHATGRVPTAWWAAGGSSVGSAAGFKAGGDEDLTSVPGVLTTIVPGFFNAGIAWRSGRIAKDVGLVDDIPGLGGSSAQAAHTVAEAIDKLPLEQQENVLARLAVERNMYNNSTPLTEGVSEASLYAFTNNSVAQVRLNRAGSIVDAAERASQTGEKQFRLIFQGQFGHGNLLDAHKAATHLKSSGVKNPLIDELLTSLTGLTKFKKRELLKAATGRHMAAVERVMYDVTTSPKKLGEFSELIGQLHKAALNNPDKAPMLERTMEKFKSAYINEGILGKAFSQAKSTTRAGDISDKLFDGQQILQHLSDNETILTTIFNKTTKTGVDEYKGLVSLARLMAFHQKGTLDQGTIERSFDRITSFFTHRLAFVFASGALTSGGGSPLANALFGTGILYAGKSAATTIISGNAMARMARTNPRLMRQYVNASIAGDHIREGRYLRALIRDTNPEAAQQIGIDEEKVQEQSGVTSGLAGRFFPFNKLPAGSPQ